MGDGDSSLTGPATGTRRKTLGHCLVEATRNHRISGSGLAVGSNSVVSSNCNQVIPSGKLTELWRKSPFLMGKSTINGHFQ